METLKIYKIGGNVIDDQVALASFLKDFAQLPGRKLLVHGGGKKATALSRTLGIESQMVEGRRITDAATLEIVVMVYAGLINKQVVAGLYGQGCPAIGLSGADGNAIRSHKRNTQSIDYGFVGDVEEVNAPFFSQLIEAGLVPVCCAITHDAQGLLLNTNADTIANEVATALAEHYEVQLHYVFEKDGVLLDPNNENSVIKHITPETFAEGKANGSISAGMIPKLDNAFAAINKGVAAVVIGAPRMLRNEGAGPTVVSHR